MSRFSCSQRSAMTGLTLSITAVLALTSHALGAQSGAPSPAIPEGAGSKNATAARFIGIVPGAGHLYAGEGGRGLTFVGGMVGIMTLGSLAFASECVGKALADALCDDSSPVLNLMSVAVMGVWAWSIFDAGRAAHRTNAKRGLTAALTLAPTRSLSVSARPVRRINLGLAIGYR